MPASCCASGWFLESFWPLGLAWRAQAAMENVVVLEALETLETPQAGMCARQRTYFSLLRQRKVGKRKATPLAVSLRFAAGNLRCSGAGRRCGTRFALAALRSDSRSESEHEAWSCCAVHARPTPCASRHGQRGWGERAIAALGSGANTGRKARTGAPGGPRSRPNQRPPWPGLYRPVAVSPLPKREGGRRVSDSGGWA